MSPKIPKKQIRGGETPPPPPHNGEDVIKFF